MLGGFLELNTKKMFKIVQTTEPNRGKCLTVVPSGWEKNVTLFWPSKKLRSSLGLKLIKNPNSLPGEGWEKLSCIKKRDNFLLYQSAEAEMKAMTEVRDSETNECSGSELKLSAKIKNPRSEIARSPQRSFNSVADEACVNSVCNKILIMCICGL